MNNEGLTTVEIAKLQALIEKNQKVGAKKWCEESRDPQK